MVILYGAGIECTKIINEGYVKDVSMIVDSYPEKYYGKLVCGHEVKSSVVLADCTTEDTVYIASKTYAREIYDAIRKINDQVNIVLYEEVMKAKIIKNREVVFALIDKEDFYISQDRDEIIDSWIESALTSEVGYWDKRIPECMSRGDRRFNQREFAYPYNEEIKFKAEDTILDVGCGPLPKFGNLIGGKAIDYLPVDPLAYQYAALTEKYNVILPVKPKFAIMEMLSSFYKENSADYVIVNNALDHSIDVLRAFIECLRTVKVGGYFLLEHMDSEGLHNHYSGLHKWNITSSTAEGGDLVFYDGNDMKVNISKLFETCCEISIKRIPQGDRELIIAKAKKTADVPKEIIQEYDNEVYVGKMVNALFKKLLTKN